MKKTTLILLLMCISFILLSNFTQYSSAEDEREWQIISSGWHSGGNISGSFYNRSVTPIFPPQEGNGIFRENVTFIKNNVSNSVIFSLDLISIPRPSKISQLGEYFIEGEKIVAVYFSMINFSNKINYSGIKIIFYSPDAEPLFSHELNMNNITTLETPIIFNVSGLWKIKIEFTLEEDSIDFYVWEDIKKWYPNDNEHYLTFHLGKESNLSFQNYYEKAFPIYTTSETIGIYQSLITEQQGEYLKDTANYLRSVSDDVRDYVEDSGFSFLIALITVIVAISALIFTIIIEIFRGIMKVRKLFKSFYSEIIENLKTVKEFKETGKRIITMPGVTFLQTNCYLNIIASGELHFKLKDIALLNKIHSAYKTIGFYNAKGEFPRERFQQLTYELSFIEENLPNELKYLKIKK